MGKPITRDDLAGLVEPTRLHQSLYLDEDIFELDMEHIWGQAWKETMSGEMFA